nr:hypothetical protein P5630_10325 [Bacillus subtilis]
MKGCFRLICRYFTPNRFFAASNAKTGTIKSKYMKGLIHYLQRPGQTEPRLYVRNGKSDADCHTELDTRNMDAGWKQE